jgi:hypothetical protein
MANENPLRDIRFCVNCQLIGQLTQTGRCGTCGSDAVMLPAERRVFEAIKYRDVYELEQMFGRCIK